MKHLYLLVVLLIHITPASAQMWRLVEEVHQETNSFNVYETEDSIRYSYNYIKARGGLPDGNPILYDLKHHSNYTPQRNINYTQHRQSFYNDDRRKIDERYRYDTSNRLVVQEVDTFYYDNGVLTDIIGEQWFPTYQGGFRWDWYRHIRYAYDSLSGKLRSIRDTRQADINMPSIYFASGLYYDYDSSGKIVRDYTTEQNTGFWTGHRIVKRNKYTYDTTGLLYMSITDMESWWIRGDLDTTMFTYYFHDSNKLIVRDSINILDTSLNTAYSIQHYYTYDTSGNMLTDSTWVEDTVSKSYNYTDRVAYTYNQYGLLTSVTTEKKNSRWNKVTYKYEPYWPVGVEEQTSENLQLKVYPNPVTSSMLRIEAELKNAQQVEITITDMQGRQIMHFTDEATQDYDKQIPVSHLSSGMYMLMLKAGDERMSRQFIIR